jgi:hypothetical protein
MDELLKATHEGKWTINEDEGIFVECYVLGDKRRVLSLRGTSRTIGLKGGGSAALARTLSRKWVNPYLSDKLKAWLINANSGNISKCVGPRSERFIPLDADLFVDVCNSYIQANNDGLFEGAQWANNKAIANKLSKIVSAFAKIGIVALIDEVTSYQEERDKNELQKLLALYISEELLPWTQRFPNEFYKQIFRLKGWQYPSSGSKRPQYVGKITNEIVYDRLPMGVLEALKNKNPLDNKGHRKYKHHQFLTEDIGDVHLEHHLLKVITPMQASKNWASFMALFKRVFPSKNDTIPLFDKDEID